jgi:putative salt-induced outer membrane protein YdiY
MHAALRRVSVTLTVTLVCASSLVFAQTPAAPPAPPPPPWTGNAGFGLSLSRGNTDTFNLNVSGEATHDPKTSSVWKFKGLYMRGENNHLLAVDRLSLDARNERSFTKRIYGFGSLQFLEDQFKDIDYLVAPSAGVGYKLVATPVTSFNVDGGFGVKVEKNTSRVIDATGASEVSRRRTDAVITASDKFEHKLSPSSALTQSFNALWKAQDFGDALYTFAAGAAAALTARTQLKIELLDTYSSRPPTAAVKSNDVALLTALVYKF